MLWSLYKKRFPVLSLYTAPALSGILLGLSYFPFIPIAMFFAYVPLWLFIFHQKNLKQVLIGAWICQFITTLIGFNWIAYTIHSFGNMPWIVSILGLLLFCSLSNIFMVFAGGFWFILNKNIPFKQKTVLTLILFPILFSLFHLLVPQLFPWHLGYAWMVGFPALQTAEIWGFRFLSTLFYIFNLFFFIIYKHKWDKIGRRALVSALILFILVNLFGIYLKKRIPPFQDTLNVVLIQNNIGNERDFKLSKKFRSIPNQIYFTTTRLTYQALIKSKKFYKSTKDINFILWPEGAYPYRIFKSQPQHQPLSSFVSRLKIPLITGAVTSEKGRFRNSLVVFDRKGKIKKPIYDKIKLLAFGEYLPLADQIPFIKNLFPYFSGRFQKGESSSVVHLEENSLGLQICYESLFDYFTRQLALQEAQIIINVTNDSWYGEWQQPWQHLFMSLARSIELRRPFIRATNTGFSTIIQSDGTFRKVSPLNKSWFSFYSIPYSKTPPKTLFMRWGFYINEIFLGLMFLFGFLYTKKRDS